MSTSATVVKTTFGSGGAFNAAPTSPGSLTRLLREMQAAVNDTGVDYRKAADALAADVTAETVIYRARAAGTVAAGRLLTGATLTAHAANYATVTIKRRDADGTNAVTVATYVSDIAGGTATAWVAKALTLSGTAANLTLTAGQFLTLTIAKAASGVVVPASLLQVDVAATAV
jgi:hypothetical protein